MCGGRQGSRAEHRAPPLSDDNGHRPADLVDRQFTAHAPNRLWIADMERHEAFSDRNLAGQLVFPLVRGHTREGCFHYIRCLGVDTSGLGDGGFVPGAGVDSDGGEGPGFVGGSSGGERDPVVVGGSFSCAEHRYPSIGGQGYDWTAHVDCPLFGQILGEYLIHVCRKARGTVRDIRGWCCVGGSAFPSGSG